MNSGGTVSYAYNLHGQTNSISGPGFSQKLYYTDGPGKPLYNGSVSAMSWTMGTDATQRGYRYSYNGYSWLTLAEYGEGTNLSDHKNRYSESSLEFMLNGGIRRLQRHGLKADGVYGKIDNLHIYYDGNRMTGVLEDAEAVTQPGSMDYPGKQKEMAFAYNEWGALIKDESRDITDIEYDRFGNPVRTVFSNGSYTRNVYSASGVKLKTEHYTSLATPVCDMSADMTGMDAFMDSDTGIDAAATGGGSYEISGLEKIEYHGPVIYRNGKIDMVQFPGGYATIDGNNVTFHYYTQDYLGNNRAVINGSTGAIEQTTAYYPYGAVITDLGMGNSGQPFRFGGKELISANGLNEYDFGARRHYSAVPHFTSIDPLCEKHPELSPYLYCSNNPINLIDLNGETPSEIEAARMADYVYGKGDVKLTGGWTESSRFEGEFKLSDDSGFSSMLFERTINGETEYAYVYAGTDPMSIKDWENNIAQIFSMSSQYETAVKNADFLNERLGKSLTFVGHSLGGGLAAASAYATGGYAMTFNAAGVSDATVDKNSSAVIDAYINVRDELNFIQQRNHLPTADGNVNWRYGNASVLGHSIKNFYKPSIGTQIYNNL